MRDPTRLKVWRRAVDLSVAVARALPVRVGRASPGIRRQAIRAACQIVEAISEECGKRSNKEFARFLDMAIGSTTELQSQIVLAVKHGILVREVAKRLYREAEAVRKMLYAFRRWLDRRDDRESAPGE